MPARFPPSRLAVLSCGELVARLSRGAERGALVAFDADGTLWSGDVGVDAFEALLERRGVREAASPALAREAASLGLAARGGPSETAAALYRAFQAGAYPEERAFQMMAWAFAGFSLSEVSTFATELVERVGLASRVHPEVRAILEWAAGEQLSTIVVSASFAGIVKIAVDRLGLPARGVTAMTTGVIDAIVQPSIVPPSTYGAGKVAALATLAPGAPLLGAFGDSAFDLPMLAAARVGVAVRPKASLVAAAAARGGIVELAPET